MVDSMFTFIAVGLIVGVHVATMIVLDLVVVQPNVGCICPCGGAFAATDPLCCLWPL